MVWGQDEEFKNKRNVPATFIPISIVLTQKGYRDLSQMHPFVLAPSSSTYRISSNINILLDSLLQSNLDYKAEHLVVRPSTSL